MPCTERSLEQGQCPLNGVTPSLESETDISKALEGHSRGLPSCVLVHSRLTVTGRNLRKTQRFHKLHYYRFPPECFPVFYIQHYSFLAMILSHFQHSFKRTFQLSYLLVPQMYSWLTGALPSGYEKKNQSPSLKENLRVYLFLLVKSIMKVQMLI